MSLSPQWRKNLAKFRCRKFKIPVETGTHYNILYDDRKCKFCSNNEIGDEYHYLLICGAFKDVRNKNLCY